jgi:hypothetical protein
MISEPSQKKLHYWGGQERKAQYKSNLVQAIPCEILFWTNITMSLVINIQNSQNEESELKKQ